MSTPRYLTLLLALCIVCSPRADAAETMNVAPLQVQTQGSFAIGGRVVKNPGTFDTFKPTDPSGQTLHGDHAHVFYQVPVYAREVPLVMWHCAGQSSKSWETTPDGREGFQSIFLRRRFPVYVIDQPRRGDAGRSTVSTTINATPDEQTWFNMFRIGTWPNYFDGVQFSRDPEALNQFFRSMTPNTGPFDVEVVSSAVSALVDKIGAAVLFTHSQAGGPGWVTAIKNRNVRGIVAFEPGSGFVFPEGEVSVAMSSATGTLEPVAVAMSQFKQLTKITIGWVQREGGPKQQIHAGDIIWTPPGVKHWHGATADSPMSHVAIVEALEGSQANWLEQVSERTYRQ